MEVFPWSGNDPKSVLRRSLGWMLIALVWIGIRYEYVRMAHGHGRPASAFQIFTIGFGVAVLLYWMVIGARNWVLLRRGARLPQETG